MTKERHWTLTTTLILIGLSNGLLAISYLFLVEANSQSDNAIASNLLPWLGLASILNVIWIFLLFNWKKIGLWAFAMTSIAKCLINYHNGTRFPELLISFVGITLILMVLQVKKGTSSGWNNLTQRETQ